MLPAINGERFSERWAMGPSELSRPIIGLSKIQKRYVKLSQYEDGQ